MSEDVDVPVTVSEDVAAAILEDLEAGETVRLELRPDDVPKIPDQLRWQLEHGEPVTELRDAYTDDS